MQAFVMHVGHPGNVDIGFTVTRTRTLNEVWSALPSDAPERPYFGPTSPLSHAFPGGRFNCWGVPNGAEPSFAKTAVGDVVLFAPSIGIHGGIEQLGIVKAKCPVRSYAASRILWPKTPDDRLYPLLFFFDTEVGQRGWFDFLDDLGYKENWQPRGWYRPLADSRFERWGGVKNYVTFLRDQCGFGALNVPA